MGESQKPRNVSVIKDVDGNSIVMINDIRFKGKRSVNWDEVMIIQLLKPVMLFI